MLCTLGSLSPKCGTLWNWGKESEEEEEESSEEEGEDLDVDESMDSGTSNEWGAF